MEKVANTGGRGRLLWEKPLRPCAAALLALAAGPGAWAQEAPALADVLHAQPGSEAPPLRMQVEASALPRLDAQDAGFQAPRVDLSLFPGRRAGGMGVVLGVSEAAAPQPPAGLSLAAARPGVDLGLRFSHRFQNQNRIDVTAWRRMNAPEDAYSLIQMQEPVYGARVEMKIRPAKFSAFGFDRGLLGFQLESGARISIKRKDGRPMLYYRTAF